MSSTCAFVGIDLAWNVEKNSSAVAVLLGNTRAVSLSCVSGALRTLLAVADFVATCAVGTTVVAVDASLVVKNKSGQRPCETAVSKEFGRYHASCHTSNLGRPHARVGMNLVRALMPHGFSHDFNIDACARRKGKWMLEVYPHPAMVRLFDLEQIIKYKKGLVVRKRAGLRELQARLAALATAPSGLKNTPDLSKLLNADVETLRGDALKEYEDSLDAFFCAFLAWHCWRWGATRNEMFGSLEQGYIVVPKRRVLSLKSVPHGL